ncbi:MAG: hypothetical protein GC200_08675 [Tepidisphaera sp.]|nr:hypothetical protein [Tepidisphaera sp.]
MKTIHPGFAARGEAARLYWKRLGALTVVVAASAPALAQVPFSCPGPSLDEWLTLGGTPMRVAVRGAAPPRLDTPMWSVDKDDDGYGITFIWQAPLAITSPDREGLILTLGRITRPNYPPGQTFAIAFRRDDGEVNWETPVPTPASGSYSGITVDPRHNTAIVCTSRWVRALRLSDGEQIWQVQLNNIIVNGMPVITTDLGNANRLFITDTEYINYSDSRLYCINVDAYDAVANPYQPGAIVWSTPIGYASGSTPGYLPACQGGVGLVYVATAPPAMNGVGPGSVLAFSAGSNAPALAWQTTNVQATGFYGGVAIAPPAAPGAHPRAYAASYNFSGDLLSSNLLSLDGVTGEVVWSTPSNRSSSTPIPLPDRRVLLSAGVQGYGSAHSVELFQETTNESHSVATLVWDTALSTWNDLNENEVIEPGEYFAIGNWTEQPVLLTANGRNLLAVGVPPDAGDFASPSNGLYLLDIDRNPTEPEFYVACSSATAAGGSAAVTGVSLASVGSDGLTLFGITPKRLDVNQDKSRGIDDLYAWESGSGNRDVDHDGVVSQNDRAQLIRFVRPTWPALRQGVLP